MPKTAEKLLSVVAYARHRGCSVTAVRKQLKRGRITATEGLIDWAQADAAWATTTRPRVGGIKPKGKPADYHSARTRREVAEAALAEARLAAERGETIRTTDVIENWSRWVGACKARLLSIPSKLAPRCAGATPAEAFVILERAILEALEELANDGAGHE